MAAQPITCIGDPEYPGYTLRLSLSLTHPVEITITGYSISRELAALAERLPANHERHIRSAYLHDAYK